MHHYEVGTTTELYKAPGATAAGPEELDGTNKRWSFIYNAEQRK